MKVEDAAVESEALTCLGELASERGAAAEALALLERGRARAADTGEREGEARAEIALARTLLGAGRAADGLVHAEAAVARAERMHAPALLWQARTVSGRVLAALGRREAARHAFERAVAAIEEWREQAAGDDERFLEDKLEPYHALVGLHAAGGDLDRALSWAEQAHARTLTDVLRHGRVDLAGQLAPAERDEQARLERRLVSLHLQRAASARGAESTGAQDDAIARTRLELAAFRARAFAARPDLRLSSGPVASDPLEDAAPLLDARTAVVVYTAAAERLHVFVLTREDGRIRPTHAVLPIGAHDLAARVGRFRALLATRDLGVRAEAGRLYRDLLAPVTERLRGRTRLVIVPDGALWELPFAALSPRAGRYLVEDAAVSYAPSLAALAALRPARRRRRRSGRSWRSATRRYREPRTPASAACPAPPGRRARSAACTRDRAAACWSGTSPGGPRARGRARRGRPAPRDPRRRRRREPALLVPRAGRRGRRARARRPPRGPRGPADAPRRAARRAVRL